MMSADTPDPATSLTTSMVDCIERVIRYHIQTKHHFHRYSRSLGYLDWANQPDPFRRFAGTRLISLPLLRPEEEPRSPSYDALYRPGAVASRAVSIRTLSRFLELALGLSAWKRAGESEWALRNNPSSGNLHPTEGYVLMPAMKELDLAPGLYHYAPKEHGLEQRAEFSAEQSARLLASFPSGAFLFGLTSVHWREAWKYGERAFRYCNHDVGHAIGAARIAAATNGWSMALLDGIEQDSVAKVLGTDRIEDFAGVEPEHPDCLAVLWPNSDKLDDGDIPLFLDPQLINELSNSTWHGTANRLSRDHTVHWDIIDDAAEASWKRNRDRTFLPIRSDGLGTPDLLPVPTSAHDAGTIIRQRRSAVAFDGVTTISSATFFRMLRLVLPQVERPQVTRRVPWDVWPYDPVIHLLLFVHRIDGLIPGLYCLVRNFKKLEFLRQSFNSDLNWVSPSGCPKDLPLYWLLEGDAKKLAAQVSCHQDIAGDSAFSFGMLAEFEGSLRERGAWWYPRMFWESGMVGQVLYLEAEAAGVRATGIGCFFDDPVHEVVAVKGMSLQSLYHFTIGGPVDDRRLLTLPAYFHLNRN